MLQRTIETADEVAHVVGLTDCGGVRLIERCDEVLATNLCGVHSDLGGEEIHRSLGCCGGFRPAGSTVRDDGRRVGNNRCAVCFNIVEGVHASSHAAGEERTEDGSHFAECARVLNHFKLEMGDLAVTRSTDFDHLMLCSAVTEVHHRLAAGLRKLDWPPAFLREKSEQKFF